MSYYDNSAEERRNIYNKMEGLVKKNILSDSMDNILKYSSDSDTYIRKNCYLILGRLFRENIKNRTKILSVVDHMAVSADEKVRQTSVYACGEIGKTDFDSVKNILNVFLNDKHHSVRNALTGAVKQMGEKNPEPVFSWVKEHLNDCSPDMRIKLLHGFELRGRTHPEDILPILNKVKDKHTDKKTRKMLVHIIGQISYKEGCLPRVVAVIKKWGDLIPECREEILKVHKKYKRFSFFNLEEAERYLAANI